MKFQDNPHVEYVELCGNINYPNVQLSETVVTFASVLNDTSSLKSLTVVNTCEVPVKYHWELTSGTIADAGVPDAAVVDSPAHQIFDIKPVEGLLQPGASESVRIAYIGRANLKAHASATMHLQGGPDNRVALHAQAGRIHCQIEPRSIRCGPTVYSQQVQRDVTISNPSQCVSKCLTYSLACSSPRLHFSGGLRSGFLVIGDSTARCCLGT